MVRNCHIRTYTSCCYYNSEFCGHQNENIPLSPSEKPSEYKVEYEIEPPPKMDETDEENKPDNETDVLKKVEQLVLQYIDGMYT